jgi:hypothetical protein
MKYGHMIRKAAAGLHGGGTRSERREMSKSKRKRIRVRRGKPSNRLRAFQNAKG